MREGERSDVKGMRVMMIRVIRIVVMRRRCVKSLWRMRVMTVGREWRMVMMILMMILIITIMMTETSTA